MWTRPTDADGGVATALPGCGDLQRIGRGSRSIRSPSRRQTDSGQVLGPFAGALANDGERLFSAISMAG
jgi:hypothetical protein